MDYLDCLQRRHDDIKRTIEWLPLAGLDLAPGPEMNSLCVIVVHVPGSGRYGIGDIVAGEPAGRNREAEFRTKEVDVHGIL